MGLHFQSRSKDENTCWCEQYEAPHVEMAGCVSAVYKESRDQQSLARDPRLMSGVKMVPDIQLASMSFRDQNIQFMLGSGERRDYHPPHPPSEPLPPPLGYNQGYLPTEYPTNTTTQFRRGDPTNENVTITDHPQIYTAGYGTLDSRKQASYSKVSGKVLPKGSYEMGSNLSISQASMAGSLNRRYLQSRDNKPFLQEHLQSVDRFKNSTMVQNIEGQESCV